MRSMSRKILKLSSQLFCKVAGRFFFVIFNDLTHIILGGLSKDIFVLAQMFRQSHGGALAREAGAAEHHRKENVVIYPTEKIW